MPPMSSTGRGGGAVEGGRPPAAMIASSSISQVIHDQTTLGEPEPQEAVEARYRTQL